MSKNYARFLIHFGAMFVSLGYPQLARVLFGKKAPTGRPNALGIDTGIMGTLGWPLR